MTVKLLLTSWVGLLTTHMLIECLLNTYLYVYVMKLLEILVVRHSCVVDKRDDIFMTLNRKYR